MECHRRFRASDRCSLGTVLADLSLVRAGAFGVGLEQLEFRAGDGCSGSNRGAGARSVQLG